MPLLSLLPLPGTTYFPLSVNSSTAEPPTFAVSPVVEILFHGTSTFGASAPGTVGPTRLGHVTRVVPVSVQVANDTASDVEFSWHIVSAPAGAEIAVPGEPPVEGHSTALMQANASTAYLQVDTTGQWVLAVTVSDHCNSETRTMIVNVLCPALTESPLLAASHDVVHAEPGAPVRLTGLFDYSQYSWGYDYVPHVDFQWSFSPSVAFETGGWYMGRVFEPLRLRRARLVDIQGLPLSQEDTQHTLVSVYWTIEQWPEMAEAMLSDSWALNPNFTASLPVSTAGTPCCLDCFDSRVLPHTCCASFFRLCLPFSPCLG